MSLEALSHVADIGTGDTRPQVFLCHNDGAQERWVLKLEGLSLGELAADLIGSLLAHRVGLRCPPVAVASVSPAALLTAPADVRAWARPGPAFACRFIEQVLSGLTDADLLAVPAEDLGRMYAFDAWLEVLDRRKPDGIWNVMKDVADGSLAVSDFGKSLSPCLHLILGAGDHMIEPDYPPAVRERASVAAAVDMCATIEGVTRADIESILVEVPPEWIDHTTRSRVVQFLAERAAQIRELCLRSLGGGAS